METQSKSSGQFSNSNQENSTDQSNSLNMGNLTEMLGGLNIPESLKKYGGTATKAISNLTTTQKVVGGAILLLGATYLSRKSGGGWVNKLSSLSKLASNRKKR